MEMHVLMTTLSSSNVQIITTSATFYRMVIFSNLKCCNGYDFIVFKNILMPYGFWREKPRLLCT